MVRSCEILITKGTRQMRAGRITLNGGKVSHSSTAGFKNLMHEIVSGSCLADGKRITVKADPTLWFESLPKNYNGSYLRARMV